MRDKLDNFLALTDDMYHIIDQYRDGGTISIGFYNPSSNEFFTLAIDGRIHSQTKGSFYFQVGKDVYFADVSKCGKLWSIPKEYEYRVRKLILNICANTYLHQCIQATL